MVSYSSFTNHECFIYSYEFTNVSFAIKSLPLTKNVDNVVTYEENFPISKTLVSFLYMSNFLQLKLWEVLQKKHVGKM